MKYLSVFILVILSATICYPQNFLFEDYFNNETLRIDYHHIGDSKTELFTIDKIYEYGIWAGSTKNLIDNFNNGKYYFKAYDVASNKLIFSKGFEPMIKSKQKNGNSKYYKKGSHPKRKFI